MAMQTYRIRAYEDDNYEIDDERVYLMALDLESARGVALARIELESARAAIARRRGLDERASERLRLAVHEQHSGAYVMDAIA
jgi:hypothetical protein